jgi:hypothetical protein
MKIYVGSFKLQNDEKNVLLFVVVFTVKPLKQSFASCCAEAEFQIFQKMSRASLPKWCMRLDTAEFGWKAKQLMLDEIPLSV